MASSLTQLPRLESFTDIPLPEPEAFAARLRDPSVRDVPCFCTSDLEEAAQVYARVNGLTDKLRTRIVESIPHAEIAQIDTNGVVPLFMSDATDADLRHRFFLHPEVVHFADFNMVRMPEDHGSLRLTTVGTSPSGIAALRRTSDERIESLVQARSANMKRVLGSDIFTYAELRKLLQGDKAGTINMHALGPTGTNIAQASASYLRDHAEGRGEVIVHPNKVEPMRYAQIAAEERSASILPLHMECAVYYDMGRLFRDRVRETVFADQHNMPLDEMQLAAAVGTDLSALQRTIRIASHPSPIALVKPWLDAEAAKYIKASSNSDAADMVLRGEADACITTESGRRTRDLAKVHSFGSPVMMFTVGTPYSMQELHERAHG